MQVVLHTRVVSALALAVVTCASSGDPVGPVDAAPGLDGGGREAAYGTPQDCEQAGGRCIVGPATGCVAEGPRHTCNCNPGCNPGGAICCIAFVDASDASVADAASSCPAGYTCTSVLGGVLACVKNGGTFPNQSCQSSNAECTDPPGSYCQILGQGGACVKPCCPDGGC